VLRLIQTATGSVQMFGPRLGTPAEFRAIFESSGQTLDETKGSILFFSIVPGEGIGTFGSPLGMTAEIDPTAQAYYVAEGKDFIDTSLTASSEGGWGFFLNLDPGDYFLTFHREGLSCNAAMPNFAHGLDEQGRVRAKVVAGLLTLQVGLLCQ
jgi:hypothetical protein